MKYSKLKTAVCLSLVLCGCSASQQEEASTEAVVTETTQDEQDMNMEETAEEETEITLPDTITEGLSNTASSSQDMGGQQGGLASHTGVGTTELPEGWTGYTWHYTDASGSEALLDFALYVPEGYTSSQSYPLVTYIGDATYVGAGAAAAAAGECPSNWISQQKGLFNEDVTPPHWRPF